MSNDWPRPHPFYGEQWSHLRLPVWSEMQMDAEHHRCVRDEGLTADYLKSEDRAVEWCRSHGLDYEWVTDA